MFLSCFFLLIPTSESLLIHLLQILFQSLKSVPISFYKKPLIPSGKLWKF